MDAETRRLTWEEIGRALWEGNCPGDVKEGLPLVATKTCGKSRVVVQPTRDCPKCWKPYLPEGRGKEATHD